MSEREQANAWRGWLIVLLACAGIVAWGMANYLLIQDAPREWDFGALPDVPGESAYSTTKTPPEKAEPPRQLTPLPEAEPDKKPGDAK